MRYDFSTIEALQTRARRERSEAVYQMLIAPVVDLFARPANRKRARHASRSHLARQG
jgi:hypothetical protein